MVQLEGGMEESKEVRRHGVEGEALKIDRTTAFNRGDVNGLA